MGLDKAKELSQRLTDRLSDAGRKVSDRMSSNAKISSNATTSVKESIQANDGRKSSANEVAAGKKSSVGK